MGSLKELPVLAREGFRLRRLMLKYLEVLSHVDNVAPVLVARLQRGSGYRDLVHDLDVIAHELHARPTLVLQGPVTPADLHRCSAVAHEMLLRLGVPEHDAVRETLLTARQQLGALLVRSHAQLRRALDYLRFEEGDAATLVPSLYVPRDIRRRRKRADDAEAEPVLPDAPDPTTGDSGENQ